MVASAGIRQESRMKKILKKFIKKIFPDKLIFLYKKKKYQGKLLSKIAEFGCGDTIERYNHGYEQLFKKYEEKYEKILIVPYYMRHIGEMCLTWYLFFHEHDMTRDKKLYVFLPILNKTKKYPNEFLFKKIETKGEMIVSANAEFWAYCVKNHYDKIGIEFNYLWESMGTRDMFYADNPIPMREIVQFNEQEEELGKNFLSNKIGTCRYICFFNRDNAYYQRILDENQCDESATSIARNSKVGSFMRMAKFFWGKGIYSIRMGSAVKESVSGKGILDYASKYHSDFLDFYLLKHCLFFVAGFSGILMLAKMFNKPIACVNVAVISFGGDLVIPLSAKYDLMIIKKYYCVKEKRYLSIREMLEMERKIPSYQLFQEYADRGIIPIENTDEEILDLAKEMYERVVNNRQYTEEEEALQEEYRSLLETEMKKTTNHWYNARMGTEFLRKNPWLLK